MKKLFVLLLLLLFSPCLSWADSYWGEFMVWGTDCYYSEANADTDNDDMDDHWENIHFGNLSHNGSEHSDADGLSDLDEYNYGTDPNLADTDGDGWSDSEEITMGTDPLDSDDPSNSNIIPILDLLLLDQ
jgi:hypothetical protein